MSTQVKGLEAVIKFLALLPNVVQAAGEEILSKTSARIEVEAKRIAPWRTGNLCRSILSEKVKPWEYRVGAKVHYAYWVEYGTSRMHERPYLRPAAKSVLAGLDPEIRLLLQTKINEIK